VTTPVEDLAATRLFEQYGDRIYRYCLVRLRSREEAEDAVQNTFLRVFRALRKGQTPRRHEAWLFKIARNVCLTLSDRNRRRTSMEIARDPDDLAADETSADALVGLPAALAELPANLRTAIVLRELRGLSYTEIAEAMGTTVSAVETLIVRARRRLAAELDRAARSVGGFLLPLAGRLPTSLLASAPAKVAAGTALVAVGAAGFGAAVVGTTSAPPRSSPAPVSVRFVPAAAARLPSAHPLRSSPHAVGAIASPSVRASVSNAAPAPAATAEAANTAPATSVSSPAAAPPVTTTATTAASTLPPPTVPVPSLPPAPALPVTVDVTVPPLTSDVQLPQCPLP
jgi:RNA polymerase sigma-70 factor (ECF subfamily)